MPSFTVKAVQSSYMPMGKKYTVTEFLADDGKIYKTAMRAEVGGVVSGDLNGDFIRKSQDGGANSYSPASGAPKQFKADPESRESIEWQTALKEARQTVKDWYDIYAFHTADAGSSSVTPLEDYAKEIDKVAVHFHNLITLKPQATVDAPKITLEDLPPVENY